MNDFWKTLAESAYNTANTVRILAINRGHNLPELNSLSTYNNVQQAFIDYRAAESSYLVLLSEKTVALGNDYCKLIDGLVPEENLPKLVKLTKKAVPIDRKISTKNGVRGGSSLDKDIFLELDDSGVTPEKYGGDNKTVSLNIDSTGRVIDAVEYDITPETLKAVPNSRAINTVKGLKGGGSLEKTLNLSLEDSGVEPGIYGNETTLTTFEVDSMGRVTGARDIPLSYESLGVVPHNRKLVLSRDFEGGGTLEKDIEISLKSSGVNPGKYGNESEVPSVRVDCKGRVTEIATTPIKPLWKNIQGVPIEVKEDSLLFDKRSLVIKEKYQGVKESDDWQWMFTEGELTTGKVPFESIKDYHSEEMPLNVTEGWQPYKGLVIYQKIGSLVYLSGLVSRVSNRGNVIAMLPEYFRPLGSRILTSTAVISNVQEFCRIDVKANGELVLIHPSTATPVSWVSLDCISFPVC